MGVPCGLTGTVELIEGDGISIVADIPNGQYTVSLSSGTLALLGTYKIYANEAARDADNPTPSSGEAAWGQAEDTLWVHDGTGWIVVVEPEQTYTPDLTNITLGDGSRSGSYRRSCGDVTFQAKFTMGATSTMGTDPSLGLPVASDNVLVSQFNVGIDDASSGAFIGFHGGLPSGSTDIQLVAVNAATAAAGSLSITSTVPMTWATGDTLEVSGKYRMETPYL